MGWEKVKRRPQPSEKLVNLVTALKQTVEGFEKMASDFEKQAEDAEKAAEELRSDG